MAGKESGIPNLSASERAFSTPRRYGDATSSDTVMSRRVQKMLETRRAAAAGDRPPERRGPRPARLAPLPGAKAASLPADGGEARGSLPALRRANGSAPLPLTRGTAAGALARGERTRSDDSAASASQPQHLTPDDLVARLKAGSGKRKSTLPPIGSAQVSQLTRDVLSRLQHSEILFGQSGAFSELSPTFKAPFEWERKQYSSFRDFLAQNGTNIDSDQDLEYLEAVVAGQMEQNPQLLSLLISTGEKTLRFIAKSGDPFWGTPSEGDSNGENKWGQLLMNVRRAYIGK